MAAPKLRPSQKSAPRVEVETDEDASISEGVEEVSAQQVASEEANENVKVSVYQEINPAPTVGNVSCVRDLGMEKLTKGVHSLPRCVAEVLVDRGIAAFV